MKEAKERLQRLTAPEEQTIVDAAYQLDAWGWPMTIPTINALAGQLLAAKGDTAPLGRNRYLGFFRRNPELRTRRSRVMDQAHCDATDKKTIKHWFGLFNNTRLLYNITDDDSYNMDEKGVMKGVGDASEVIVPVEEGESFSAQPSNREWVSIIECISANCFLLPPFAIFEGLRIQHD